MILLIDNYDSFVHNLARYVRELGGDAVVRRNDAVTLGEIEALAPSHIILSPGPCSPAEAGISTDLVRHFGPTIPVFGVCLGHQCIGAAYGGDDRARRPAAARPNLACRARRVERVRRACRRRFESRVITRSSSRDPLCRLRCGSSRRRTTTARSWPSSTANIRWSACSFTPSRRRPSTATRCSTASCTARARATTELPTGADGGESVHRGPETTLPWARRDDEGDGAFVPPPVDLVR